MLARPMLRIGWPRDVAAQLLQQGVHLVPLRFFPLRSLGSFFGGRRTSLDFGVGQDLLGVDRRWASERDLEKCSCCGSRY